MSKAFFISILFILMSMMTWAQDTLTLNQAIDEALKNNFGNLAAGAEARIVANNTNRANAGYLPTLDLLAVQNNSVNNVRQELLNGSQINRNGAKQSTLNLSANAQWIVFNGFGREILYNRLQNLNEIAKLTYKRATEEVIITVLRSYYNVVRQQQLLLSADTARVLAEQRLKLAELRSETGSGSKLDYYQARVDLNSRKAAVLSQRAILENAKAALNLVLGRKATEPVNTSSRYEINKEITDKAISEGLNANRELAISRMNISLARLDLRTWEAQRYPSLGIQASYSFIQSKSDANFVLSNRTLGLSYGFTASWTLFNGFYLDRNIRNARIGMQVADYRFRETELRINVQSIQAYNNYKKELEALTLEEENIGFAQLTLNISTEKYRQGAISLLQLKDIENSYVEAESRLANARYNARIAEAELMRLSGQLVK